MGSVSSYRDLVVWQRGVELCLDVYRLTARFPKEELYGLAAQMRRCVVSIPSNIAEGHARDSTKDYLRFIAIARGSLAELETQITIAKHLTYFDAESSNQLLGRCEEESRMLTALRVSLVRRLQN